MRSFTVSKKLNLILKRESVARQGTPLKYFKISFLIYYWCCIDFLCGGVETETHKAAISL